MNGANKSAKLFFIARTGEIVLPNERNRRILFRARETSAGTLSQCFNSSTALSNAANAGMTFATATSFTVPPAARVCAKAASFNMRTIARYPSKKPMFRNPAIPGAPNLMHRRIIKDPCLTCGASRVLCLCDAIPKIEVQTRICLVIHHRELSRNSNTGLLAIRALANSEVRVRGEGNHMLDLKDLLNPRFRTFLLFPAADAVELDGALASQDRTPIQLIVPDGTWRQASKMYARQPELKRVPRVKIGAPAPAIFQLRAQSRPEGMATLQAIAAALGVIEGDAVRAQLMNLYQAKIERALLGRGMTLGGTYLSRFPKSLSGAGTTPGRIKTPLG